jgi:manganese-dependent inorganic pyrophosphatase
MDSIKQKIYIVGHTKPDLDAIASAYSYQQYRNSLGEFNYMAIRCDRVNTLTEWVFEKYNTPTPPLIPDISGLNVVLVDHTFPEHRAKGWEKANILEVIDHHDVKLEDIIPQRITIRPCGSTTSLVANMMVKSQIYVPKNTAGILLSAILDDTLGLMSPTTTPLDIKMVDILSKVCGIEDIQEYSMKLFEKKDVWNILTAKEIIEEDMREVEIDGNWVSISQVETLNNGEFNEDELIKELEDINDIKPFSIRVIMLTDVRKRDCLLLIVGKDISLLQKVLDREIKDNRVYLNGVVSRKRQVLPLLESMYSS